MRREAIFMALPPGTAGCRVPRLESTRTRQFVRGRRRLDHAGNRRGDGTSWVDSHYRFQIGTFWIGTLVALAGVVASLVVVGLIVLILLPFWLLIRCIRGWKFLSQGAPHPKPASWLIG